MEASALPRRGRFEIPFGKMLLSRLADEALVEQVRRGNERAFEVVYDRYHAGLLAFCRQMLGGADEAEDALQQAFVSAHADLLRSSRPIALRAWLYAIARNRCLSMLRTRREQTSELVEPVTSGLSEHVEEREELRALLGDVRQLPAPQRAALVLAEVGDLSHEEIGRVIGCEAVKVKALIFQARSSLIDARRARETPCAEIRQQLATLRGGALRRSELRRHVKACPGCAEFREEVRRQRAMMAVLLPVVPSVGLKRSILAAAGAGGGAGGAGLAAGLVAKGGLAKLAVIGAIGGAAVGGGVAIEKNGGLPLVGGQHPATPGAKVTSHPAARSAVSAGAIRGATPAAANRTEPASLHKPRESGAPVAPGARHAREQPAASAHARPVAGTGSRASEVALVRRRANGPAHSNRTHTRRPKAHAKAKKKRARARVLP